MEQLVELLNALKTTIESLSAQLADTKAALDVQVEAAKAEGYAKGFEDGKASVVGGGFTQADIDAAVAAAIAPLTEKISVLEVQVVALQSEMETKILAGIEAFKAELLAQYESQQVVESTSETGFKALLSPSNTTQEI